MSLPRTPVCVARNAMATRFEIALHGDDPVALRAAAEEALDEVDRCEDHLSLYRPISEVSRLNSRAHLERVRVTPELFEFLVLARRLHEQTHGAFDITVGPLVRAWGFMTGTGNVPDEEDLSAARAKVGMQWVDLRASDCTVHFQRGGMMLDLGSIGKGYAIERAASLLREAGITSALLHGGTSTVYAIGHPPDQEAWKIGLEIPPLAPDTQPTPIGVVLLRDEALSVSAVWGKSFQVGDSILGHVLDPRTGAPCDNAHYAAVAWASAAETDALSTALLIAGLKGHDPIAHLRPGMRTLVLRRQPASLEIVGHGLLAD